MSRRDEDEATARIRLLLEMQRAQEDRNRHQALASRLDGQAVGYPLAALQPSIAPDDLALTLQIYQQRQQLAQQVNAMQLEQELLQSIRRSSALSSLLPSAQAMRSLPIADTNHLLMQQIALRQASQPSPSLPAAVASAPQPSNETAAQPAAAASLPAAPTTLNNDPFPVKLYSLIMDCEERDETDIISFGSDDKCFRIHDRSRFMNVVVPRFFRSLKYSTFKRQLYTYGFEILHHGPDEGSFAHPSFERNKPEQLKNIVRSSKGQVERRIMSLKEGK